jgi:hypothetical protein
MIATGRAYWSGVRRVACRAGAVVVDVVVVVMVAVVARDVGLPASVTRDGIGVEGIVVGTVVRDDVFAPIAYRFLSSLPT